MRDEPVRMFEQPVKRTAERKPPPNAPPEENDPLRGRKRSRA